MNSVFNNITTRGHETKTSSDSFAFMLLYKNVMWKKNIVFQYIFKELHLRIWQTAVWSHSLGIEPMTSTLLALDLLFELQDDA